MENKKRLTLKDIAAKAGVSLTAASMFLNGKAKKYNLADATCDRIEQTMRENNFVPNFHARAIASKQTMLVGVMVYGGLETSFWLNIISGIEETLAAKGYHLLLAVSHASLERELESIRFMSTKGIDALIIAPVSEAANNFDYLRELDKNIPVVTVNTRIEGLAAAYNDNYTGGRLASEFLIRRGHRQIAFIGGLGSTRARAFFDVMLENQIEPSVFLNVSDFIKQSGRFTAAFCFSDYQVLELYHEVAARGIKIPENISVAGYDNMDFIRLLSPRPATVEQYKKELGVAAAEIVLDRIRGNPAADRKFTPVLHEGESVRLIYT